jgi:CTP:molybdopterin cytidylyltransferase MocA
VIWPRRLFPELIGLSGDQGGKRLIEAQGDRAIGVATAGRDAEVDIDTVDELAAYLAARSSQPL